MKCGARKMLWDVIGNYAGMGRMRVMRIWMGEFGGGVGNRGRAMEGREYLCVHEEVWEGRSRTVIGDRGKRGGKIGIRGNAGGGGGRPV